METSTESTRPDLILWEGKPVTCRVCEARLSRPGGVLVGKRAKSESGHAMVHTFTGPTAACLHEAWEYLPTK